MTDNSLSSVTRRVLLGGVTSLAAAASFSLTMSGSVAARVSDGSDSARRTVSSPDGRIELTVGEQPSFDGNVTGNERSSTDETWQPFWDQYDEIRNRHEELRIGLCETGGLGPRVSTVCAAG